MPVRILVLTCFVVGGCAGQSANPNGAVSNAGRAGQSETTGPPSDLGQADPRSDLTIALRDSGPNATFEVSGLPAEDLAKVTNSHLDPAEWTEILSVRVMSDATANWRDQPAMVGKYSVEGAVVRFKPQFPLMAGLTYRVVFDPKQFTDRISATGTAAAAGGDPKPIEPIVRDFSIPKPNTESSTVVSHVFPSADTLPENQLKFYVHFSAPMSRGEAYRRVHLLDASGSELMVPFLELDEELWDRQGRRLTMFIDPGRIKRGLKPREEVGPVFEEGNSYTLVVDREWLDADGNPLQQAFRKQIHIGPADEKQPDPNAWNVLAPTRDSTEPLLVRFPEPLDHAMLHRVIVVHDSTERLIAGDVKVDENETRWALTPTAPWKAGDYTIEVQTDLEDLAGNSIARVFDVDVLEPISRSIKAERWSVPFHIE